MLSGSNMLDKAQIEKSVLYPAFLFWGGEGKLVGKRTICGWKNGRIQCML